MFLKNKLIEKNKFNNKDIRYKIFNGKDKKIKKINKRMLKDPFYNKLHLSAYSGHLNDPNGLSYFNNKFHIFYQWSPYTPIHAMKHWGHFETNDFINYDHTGIAIYPEKIEEKDGIFSGGAITEKNKMYLFWTGNIKSKDTKDKDRSSWTLVGDWDDNNKKVINKKALFEVNKNIYTGHFRDPRPIKLNGKYYLFHGAQRKNLSPAIVVYESHEINKNYVYKGEIEIKNPIKDAGYMWECPDIINLNGKDFLIISPQGMKLFKKDNQNRDNTIFIPGNLDIENLVFDNEKPKMLDYGFDFYAPQIFNGANNRKIVMGWAGAVTSESHPTFDNLWAHNLTIPREISLNNDGEIIQNPIKEYKKLRKYEENNKLIVNLKESRLLEVICEFKDEFEFELVNKKGERIYFQFKGNEFFVSRKEMSFKQAKHFGETRKKTNENKFYNLRIFIDNSLIELYANNGEFVFTTKYWLTGNIKLISAKNLNKIFHLDPIKIEWNK